MNRLMLWASTAALSFAVVTPVFADDLNPQPEPPGRSKMLHNPTHLTTSTIGSATSGAGSGKALVVHQAGGTHFQDRMLNPQPLPPKSSVTNGMLNPQPLPPKSSASSRMLNPQPLPPKSAVQNESQQ